MTTSKMTNKQALEFAIALAQDAQNNELAEKLTRMLETVNKKANAPKQPSKTQLQNKLLAEKMLEAMPVNGEAVGTAWAMEKITGIMTPQKATAIFKILVDNGEIVKAEPVNGKVCYIKAEH